MKIYLDFDGTIVEHQYPKIGRCNFGCFEVIKKLQDAGHEIILNTYRSEIKDGTLEAALKYINEDHWMLLKSRKMDESFTFELNPIIALNRKEYPHPFNIQQFKESGIMFIDDNSLDIPLKKAVMTPGMMVDWDELDKLFIEHGIYEHKR